MNGLVQEVLIQVVVDMLVTESSSGSTSTGVPPVVMVVGDVKVSRIDVSESVAVADQRALPMIVEVVPGHCDPIRGANDIELSIVVIRTNLNRDLRAELWSL